MSGPLTAQSPIEHQGETKTLRPCAGVEVHWRCVPTCDNIHFVVQALKAGILYFSSSKFCGTASGTRDDTQHCSNSKKCQSKACFLKFSIEHQKAKRWQKEGPGNFEGKVSHCKVGHQVRPGPCLECLIFGLGVIHAAMSLAQSAARLFEVY